MAQNQDITAERRAHGRSSAISVIRPVRKQRREDVHGNMMWVWQVCVRQTDPGLLGCTSLTQANTAVRPGDLYRLISALIKELERMAPSKTQATIQPPVSHAIRRI